MLELDLKLRVCAQVQEAAMSMGITSDNSTTTTLDNNQQQHLPQQQQRPTTNGDHVTQS